MVRWSGGWVVTEFRMAHAPSSRRARPGGLDGGDKPRRSPLNNPPNHLPHLPWRSVMARPGGYFAATRHPWPCLLFVLPLLVGYETGVRVLGGSHPETLRNGADNWLRCGLTAVGLSFFWLPPALLTVIFVVWSWLRQDDYPDDLLGVLS